MSARAYVGLGGNLGNREATLRSATSALSQIERVELTRASPVFETTAVGPSSEPFLNAAVELATTLPAPALLEHLHAIERDHGRERRIRWDARTLDLDLLLYFDASGLLVRCSEQHLALPHPAIADRDFVLAPLAELIPDVILDGTSLRDRLAALPDAQRTIQRRLSAALLG